MAINREALKKTLADNKARREAGNIRYIGEGKTVNLRVLEFVDENGESQFARTVVHFRRSAQNKDNIINRQKTFGASCACTRLAEMLAESGEPSPFQNQQTRYYVNAINVDQNPPKVEIWALPTSVWEALATMLVSDDWQDILEPKTGHAIMVQRTGKGLDTEYPTSPARKPWPVSDALLKQVKDPLKAIADPGIVGQCEALGIPVEDIFPEGTEDLELPDPINTGETATPSKAPAGKTPPKTPTKTPARAPEPDAEEATIEVGSRVAYEIEGTEHRGNVLEINVDKKTKKSVATVEFPDYDADSNYEIAVDELALAPELPADGEGEGGDEESELLPVGTVGHAPVDGYEGVFPGKISGHTSDGRYEIAFDDGDEGECDASDFEPATEEEPETPPPAPKGVQRATPPRANGAGPVKTDDLPVVRKTPGAAASAKGAASKLVGKAAKK